MIKISTLKFPEYRFEVIGLIRAYICGMQVLSDAEVGSIIFRPIGICGDPKRISLDFTSNAEPTWPVPFQKIQDHKLHVEPCGHYSIRHGPHLVRTMSSRSPALLKDPDSFDAPVRALIWELLNADLILSFSKLASIRFVKSKSDTADAVLNRRAQKARLGELVHLLKIMEVHDSKNVEKAGAFVYEDAMTTVAKALFPQMRDFEHTQEIKLTQADVKFLRDLEPADFEGNVLIKKPISDKNVQFLKGDTFLKVKDDKITISCCSRFYVFLSNVRVPEIRHYEGETLCELFKDMFEREYLAVGSKVQVKSVRRIRFLKKEEIPIVL